jgi:uncharacterized protein YjcR
MPYTEAQKQEAKALFIKGWKVAEIEADTGINRRTVYNWIGKEQWETAFSGQTLVHATQRRYLALLEQPDKGPDGFREMAFLVNQLEKLEKIEERRRQAAEKAKQAEAGRTPSDADPAGGAGGRASGGQAARTNDFSGIDPQELLAKFRQGLFAYQLDLFEHRRERIRNILKSRQIGATWYFAREAFCDAILTGDNQIFLSASRAQADVFREYIRAFALEWFEAEIKGKDKITITGPKGVATLYFLSTNSSTAQSYHGHVYCDEYFWIPKFEKLNKVASAMASHKKWRKTYFSTPSAKSHDAYPFWSGDLFNERNKAAGRKLAEFPSKDEMRRAGVSCIDGQWRRVITIEDAQKEGCDLFDIDQLKLEYGEGEFDQLFMACFIDDSASVFRLSQLEHCMVESSGWRDVDYSATPPYAGPVWIGYDPARHGDGAAIIVIAPPTTVMGRFRIVEKLILRGVPWPQQARVIEELAKTYRVDYIGIDRTGPGDGVFESVQLFFPQVTGIYYTLEEKVKLVLKAQQIINDRRLQFDAGHSDITAGFMQIKRAVTPVSGKITYVSDRNDKTGHADAAWAVMHALINEGLMEPDRRQQVEVVFGE